MYYNPTVTIFGNNHWSITQNDEVVELVHQLHEIAKNCLFIRFIKIRHDSIEEFWCCVHLERNRRNHWDEGFLNIFLTFRQNGCFFGCFFWLFGCFFWLFVFKDRFDSFREQLKRQCGTSLQNVLKYLAERDTRWADVKRDKLSYRKFIAHRCYIQNIKNTIASENRLNKIISDHRSKSWA